MITEYNKQMPFIQKLKNLFISPIKLFENIDIYPNFGLPLAFVVILNVISSILSYPAGILQTNEISNQVKQIYGSSIIPIQDTTMTTYNMIIIIFGSVISLFITLLLTSFFLMLISKILKGQANFNKTFSLVIHTYMLYTLFLLLTSIIKYLLNNYIDVFSLAIFSPTINFSSFSYSLLFMITLYAIWQTILNGMGLSIINKYSKTKGYTVAFIVYILSIIIQTISIQFYFFSQSMLTNMP